MILEAMIRAYLSDTLRHVQVAGTIAARRVVMPGDQPEVYSAGWADAVQAMASALELIGEQSMIDAAPRSLEPVRTMIIRPPRPLTRRQRELALLIAEGLNTEEIADRMCIAYDTVKSHRQNLYDRLGVHNVAQLVDWLHANPAEVTR